MKYFKMLPLLLVFSSFGAHSGVLSFNEIWESFFLSSEEMESVRKEKEANELAFDRARLHWLPSVSLSGQWSDTNDPGLVFFNNLGQRSVTQTDFIPSNLNRPDRQQFLNGTVNIDLPLYEGGMKKSQVSLLDKILEASKENMKAKKTEQYSELARKYGSLLVHQKTMLSLKDLKNSLDKIISSYQVGSKSNPIGYSGLLGLKGVSNRVSGLLTVLESQYESNIEWISRKAGVEHEWGPVLKLQLSEFLDEALVEDAGRGFSSMLGSNEFKVSSMVEAIEMEKARFLPKVGAFANNTLYSGDRDTESAQSVGIYIMWQLFNSDSYNRVSEARAKALAARSKLQAAQREEAIIRSNLRVARESLEKNISLLMDSTGLLEEQAKTSMRLFKSGLLNALQLAEVINRRVDVTEQMSNAEMQYLDVRSKLYQLSH